VISHASLSKAKLDKLIGIIPGFDPRKNAGDFVFDYEAATLVIDFFLECIRHVKGAQAGDLIKLEEWQMAILANIFGWKRPDGTRRFREVFIFVPRKNGKTTLIAGIVLYLLFCDGEQGAEIYSAAADREQAALIYEQAKGMLSADDDLRLIGTVHKSYKSIVHEASNSSYKAISSEVETKHGYNAHGIVIDELHAIDKPEFVDVLLTSTGSRRQPLMIYITTSDYHRESICNTKYDYAAKVRDGIIEDHSFLPVIYEASINDDWRDPKIWRKANPNLGISISEDYLERECKRAQDSPTYENTFKRLHLNIRTEQDVRWLSMDRWDQCDGNLDLEELKRQPCYAGLDLSSTRDITALVLLFPKKGNAILPFFWIPEKNAHERERRDRVPYLTWARQGFMERTPGESIDYKFIRSRLNQLKEIYDIKEIAFDPWNATQLATQLKEEDGFEMVQFRQGFVSMNEPTKHLEALMLKKRIRHGSNPVLRWMASNITVREDPAGNLKPDKEKSTEKIDGMVALIMALGRAMVEVESESVYSERGLLWF